LVGLIAEEISDGRVLRLIRSFLEAGVMLTVRGSRPRPEFRKAELQSVVVEHLSHAV